jgi:hypothetical protein
MKLTALLSSISLLAAGTFASPVTNSLETQRSEGEGNLLETRDNGLKNVQAVYSLRLIIMSTLFWGSKTEFCADQYCDVDMSDALGAGADHAMEGSTIRSREGSSLLHHEQSQRTHLRSDSSSDRYPYRFLNKDRDGNDEVSLPSDSLCAQSGATEYEWPILRSGDIFGTEGNKRAGDDRVILATYDPPGDSPKVWAFCTLVTEGASRPGGFTECT